MVFKNISAEFLEDTVILVSIIQRHDIGLASSNNIPEFTFPYFIIYIIILLTDLPVL